MSQQTFASMSQTDFEQLIDGYIDRAADEMDMIPVDHFFDLLFHRITANHVQTVTLLVTLDHDQVVITPDHEVGDVEVCGNEIFIAGHRLVLQPWSANGHDQSPLS